MLIAGPGPGTGPESRKRLVFPKEKKVKLLLKVRMEIGQAKSTDAFLAPTAKSRVPYGRTSPMAGRFYFCPALKRTKKVVSGAPRRAGYDLDSSPWFSFFPLPFSFFPSSVPHPYPGSRHPPVETGGRGKEGTWYAV